MRSTWSVCIVLPVQLLAVAFPAWSQTTIETDGDVEAQGFIGNGSQVTNVNAETLDGNDSSDFAGATETAELLAAMQNQMAQMACTTGSSWAGAPEWRYVDLGDGTVLDCNTRKIWLKDASCLGTGPWGSSGTAGTVQNKVADLNSGTDFSCSDYTPGTYTDWEVPEMASMCGLWNGSCVNESCCTASQGIVDTSVSGLPKVANGKGDARWTPGNVFVGVQSAIYWSAPETDANFAWNVSLFNGFVGSYVKGLLYYVWPVRSGQ